MRPEDKAPTAGVSEGADSAAVFAGIQAAAPAVDTSIQRGNSKMRTGVALCLTIVALTSSACSDNSSSPASRAPAEIRRDSAGIEIIEIAAPGDQQRPSWVVEPNPAADIGMRDGPVEYLLANVSGAVRLSDGRIVIAERRATLKYYDSTGKYLKMVSLRGEGPGELEAIDGIVPHRGDSLLITCCGGSSSVLRSGQPRTPEIPSTIRTHVSVHDSAGKMGRNAQLSWSGAPRRVSSTASGGTVTTSNGFNHAGFEGAGPDGSFITRGSAWPPLEGSPGRRWIRTPYFRIAADGSAADTMIVLPTTDIEEVSNPDDRDRIPVFYRNAPPVAISDRWMYWGNSETFEILAYDLLSDSRLTQPARIVRYALPNRAADAALLDRFDEMQLRRARNREDSSDVAENRATRPKRPSLPAYEAMQIDASGNLWVRHSRLFDWGAEVLDASEPQTWTVIDPRGSVLGNAVTPADLEITQIGNGWILGIWEDVDDVQHVRVYRLRPAL